MGAILSEEWEDDGGTHVHGCPWNEYLMYCGEIAWRSPLYEIKTLWREEVKGLREKDQQAANHLEPKAAGKNLGSVLSARSRKTPLFCSILFGKKYRPRGSRLGIKKKERPKSKTLISAAAQRFFCRTPLFAFFAGLKSDCCQLVFVRNVHTVNTPLSKHSDPSNPLKPIFSNSLEKVKVRKLANSYYILY